MLLFGWRLQHYNEEEITVQGPSVVMGVGGGAQTDLGSLEGSEFFFRQLLLLERVVWMLWPLGLFTRVKR